MFNQTYFCNLRRITQYTSFEQVNTFIGISEILFLCKVAKSHNLREHMKMCNENSIKYVSSRAIYFQVGTITKAAKHCCSKANFKNLAKFASKHLCRFLFLVWPAVNFINFFKNIFFLYHVGRRFLS